MLSYNCNVRRFFANVGNVPALWLGLRRLQIKVSNEWEVVAVFLVNGLKLVYRKPLVGQYIINPKRRC